jgi:hypothetical protein
MSKRQCAGFTRSGARCNGGAMKGSPFCGPHQNQRRRPPQYPAVSQAEHIALHESARHTTLDCACGRVAPCPRCGLVVHVTGKLVSYHVAVNGCPADAR